MSIDDALRRAQAKPMTKRGFAPFKIVPCSVPLSEKAFFQNGMCALCRHTFGGSTKLGMHPFYRTARDEQMEGEFKDIAGSWLCRTCHESRQEASLHCAYCYGKIAINPKDLQPTSAMHRDGFGEGPELPMCASCARSDEEGGLSLEEWWRVLNEAHLYKDDPTPGLQQIREARHAQARIAQTMSEPIDYEDAVALADKAFE